jgi:hypothetical protein
MNISLSVGGAAGIESTLLRCASLSADDVANEARAWTEKATKDNFEKYGANHKNKLGGSTTSYWLRASDATRATSTGGTITIEVFESRGTGGTGGLVGVRRHYTGGGTIKPSGRISEITKKPIQYLTIPIAPAAHGRTVAALMQRLGVDIYRKGSALFMHAKGSDRSDSDTAVFALKKSIGPQRPNPAILPTDTEYYAAINTAVDELLNLD